MCTTEVVGTTARCIFAAMKKLVFVIACIVIFFVFVTIAFFRLNMNHS